MKISIVITTYNRLSSLTECLASLETQDYAANDYEIVVVSDGSSDGTLEFLKSYTPKCGFQWISQENQGQPTAQNVGVAAARGDLVLFMDDDCICDRGMLAAHAAAHQSAEKLVVLGTAVHHPESSSGTFRRLKLKRSGEGFRRLSTEGPNRADLMLCANTSIARQGALECPFDPSFRRIHDIEAGMRLWMRGYRLAFESRAIVWERFAKSIDSSRTDSYLQGKFEVILSQRFPEFRSIATLAGVSKGSLLKRAIRKFMGLHPHIAEFALKVCQRFAEQFSENDTWAGVAQKALSARLMLAMIAGGIDQAGSWSALEQQFGMCIPVLMYHNVGIPQAAEYPGLTMTPEAFEKQIAYLARKSYKTICPTDWLAWRSGGSTLPDRPVMLIFDDAYENLCVTAFPILERYGFRAACMVVTDFVGSTNRWEEGTGRPSFQLISEQAIREWSGRGIEFGGHTARHVDLRSVSEQEVQQEVGRCHEYLSDLLGKAPTSFAYPFGGYSASAYAQVNESFSMAFTTRQGLLSVGTDPHLVPRVSWPAHSGRLMTWCCLHLGINPKEKVREYWFGALAKIQKSMPSSRALCRVR